MIVKLKDVAIHAGVSEATASLVLNEKPGIKESTRVRVLEAAKTLGYTPNGMAQGLATSRTNTIGLIVTDIENPFFGSLTRYIDQSVRSQKFGLILSVSNDDLETEDRILHDFIRKRVEGIIVVPSYSRRKDFKIYDTLEKRNIPVVFTTTYYIGRERLCVMTDLAKGSFLLTSYLLDLGHRNIAFFLSADPGAAISELRLKGFKRAFEEKNISMNEKLIVRCSRPDYHSAYQSANLFLKEKRVDAVVTINDYMALGVKRAAEELGYAIPGDLSIAGYDDVAFASLSEIPLTTVRQPIPAIGRETGDLLFRLIGGKHTAAGLTLVEPELIVRQSTGPVSVRNLK